MIPKLSQKKALFKEALYRVIFTQSLYHSMQVHENQLV